MDFLKNFLSDWWDVLLFIAFTTFHVWVWLSIRKALPKPKNFQKILPGDLETRNSEIQERGLDLQERQFAATIVASSSTTSITAVSILIPASLIIVQLGFGSKSFPHDALNNVFRASLWFLFSLLLGLYVIFNVAMRSQSRNVAQYFPVGVVFAPQLFALAVGVLRLVIGIANVVGIH
jgi:hypothetical protein